MPDPDEYGAARDGEDADRVLGPDERDRDLLDGSWESEYYAGRARRRDWSAVGVGITLLLLAGLLLPVLLLALR